MLMLNELYLQEQKPLKYEWMNTVKQSLTRMRLLFLRGGSVPVGTAFVGAGISLKST